MATNDVPHLSRVGIIIDPHKYSDWEILWLASN
jgi:hypothetical protein